MKLFLLENREDLAKDDDPWKLWYDKAFGFVIRAIDERAARELAASQCGDESKKAWQNSGYSTCVELTADGIAEVILRNFSAA